MDGEVDGVRKAPEEGATNATAHLLVLERSVGDAVLSRADLIEELKPKPWSFVLVPLECRLHIEIGGRLRDRPILDNRGFLALSARRSVASYAERARLGSRRYSARRSSASAKWLSGTGSSPGFSAIRSQSSCRYRTCSAVESSANRGGSGIIVCCMLQPSVRQYRKPHAAANRRG